jgi:hypothetical protein
MRAMECLLFLASSKAARRKACKTDQAGRRIDFIISELNHPGISIESDGFISANLDKRQQTTLIRDIKPDESESFLD